VAAAQDRIDPAAAAACRASCADPLRRGRPQNRETLSLTPIVSRILLTRPLPLFAHRFCWTYYHMIVVQSLHTLCTECPMFVCVYGIAGGYAMVYIPGHVPYFSGKKSRPPAPIRGVCGGMVVVAF